MSTTLVGLFDTRAEAQAACSKLEAAGIDKKLMRVSHDEAASILASAKPSAQPEKEQGAIRRFFAELFGDSDQESAAHFSEAVRRGNAVLTVHVANEARADAISDLMEDCGAVDVDERVEAWIADGYAAPIAADPVPPRQTPREPLMPTSTPGRDVHETQPYLGVERRLHRTPFAHDDRRVASR